jgi:hypothetical protein
MPVQSSLPPMSTDCDACPIKPRPIKPPDCDACPIKPPYNEHGLRCLSNQASLLSNQASLQSSLTKPPSDQHERPATMSTDRDACPIKPVRSSLSDQASSPAIGRGSLRHSRLAGRAASPLSQAVIGRVAYPTAAHFAQKSYVPVCPTIARTRFWRRADSALNPINKEVAPLNHRPGSLRSLDDGEDRVYNPLTHYRNFARPDDRRQPNSAPRASRAMGMLRGGEASDGLVDLLATFPVKALFATA